MVGLIRRSARVARRGMLVVVLSLGGCSLWEEPISDWERPSGSEEQTSADLSACRAEARAVIERDSAIDSDIQATQPPTATSTNQPDIFTNLDAFEQDNRYNRIVNNCMRQRGYVLPQKVGS
jgi:hypothetical protein